MQAKLSPDQKLVEPSRKVTLYSSRVEFLKTPTRLDSPQSTRLESTRSSRVELAGARLDSKMCALICSPTFSFAQSLCFRNTRSRKCWPFGKTDVGHWVVTIERCDIPTSTIRGSVFPGVPFNGVRGGRNLITHEHIYFSSKADP